MTLNALKLPLPELSFNGIARPIRVMRRVLFGGSLERDQTLYLLKMACRGIDLSLVRREALNLPPSRAEWHANSGGPELMHVLRSLQLSRECAVLDLGSGKGGAMITLAQYGFRRVHGVDLSHSLLTIANRNFDKLGIANVSVSCCDAGSFKEVDDFTVLYLFNPFPECVLTEVLDNFQLSLARRPRAITVLYKNPVCHDVLLRRRFRKTAEFLCSSLPFYVYVN
jgi:SAM-dependent methyltransferase